MGAPHLSAMLWRARPDVSRFPTLRFSQPNSKCFVPAVRGPIPPHVGAATALKWGTFVAPHLYVCRVQNSSSKQYCYGTGVLGWTGATTPVQHNTPCRSKAETTPFPLLPGFRQLVSVSHGQKNTFVRRVLFSAQRSLPSHCRLMSQN